MIGLIDNRIEISAHLARLILFILILMSWPGPPALAEDVDVYDANSTKTF